MTTQERMIMFIFRASYEADAPFKELIEHVEQGIEYVDTGFVLYTLE